jgi:hypothetical protein
MFMQIPNEDKSSHYRTKKSELITNIIKLFNIHPMSLSKQKQLMFLDKTNMLLTFIILILKCCI